MMGLPRIRISKKCSDAIDPKPPILHAMRKGCNALWKAGTFAYTFLAPFPASAV